MLKDLPIFLVFMISPVSAWAYQNDRNLCAREAQAAREACTSNDLYAGFQGQQGVAARALRAQVTGTDGKVSSDGSNQAAQCQNQAVLNHQLAQLSDMKSDACAAALESCVQTCDFENNVYSQELQFAELVMDNEGASHKRDIVDNRTQSSTICNSYRANAQRAREQAAAMRSNAGTNGTCTSKSASGGPDEKQRGIGDQLPSPSHPFGAMFDGIASNHVADNASNNAASGSRIGSGVGVRGADAREGSGGSGAASGGGMSSIYFDSQTGAYVEGSYGKLAGAGKISAAGFERGRAVGGGGGANGAVGGGRGPASAAGGSSGPRGDRELAGMRVKAIDGITGPYGRSLFEKVTSQYRRQQHIFVNEAR